MILKQEQMPNEKASLRIQSFRKENHYAVVMELPERVEYFLSYHSSITEAEKAFAKHLNLKAFVNWYPTIEEFVLDFLRNSELTITKELMAKDIRSCGLNPKAHMTEELKSPLRERYGHLK